MEQNMYIPIPYVLYVSKKQQKGISEKLYLVTRLPDEIIASKTLENISDNSLMGL